MINIRAQKNDVIEIDIFDEIGDFGIHAKDFIAELKKYPDAKAITLRINSLGGDVFEGLAIYNALKRHPATVTAVVYGCAASIASIIAMAGDKIVMPENTFLFLHDPLSGIIGDADDMRAMADELEKIGAGLVATYTSKTGKKEEEVKRWMAEDTWFSAAEALAVGLADEVTSAVKIAARAGVAKLKNVPQPLKALVSGNADPTPFRPETIAPANSKAAAHEREIAANIARAATDAGFPQFIPYLLDHVEEAHELKSELARAQEIRALCADSGCEHRADTFFLAGFSPERVEIQLVVDYPPPAFSDARPTLDQARKYVEDTDRIRGAVCAAGLPKSVADRFILDGVPRERVHEALVNWRYEQANESSTMVDSRLGDMFATSKKFVAPLIDYKAIYDARKQKGS